MSRQITPGRSVRLGDLSFFNPKYAYVLTKEGLVYLKNNFNLSGSIKASAFIDKSTEQEFYACCNLL